jgi:two-component system OmpR family response regulator
MSNKVLVVEDDPATRKAVEFILGGVGLDVLLTSSVSTGLALAPDADVILLDLKLGNETGEEFLQELRRRGLYTPVVVFSGVYPRVDVEERLKEYQIVDFLEKPFTASDLIEKVEAASRMAESMADLSESTDRLKRATASLQQAAGANITEIGQRY